MFKAIIQFLAQLLGVVDKAIPDAQERAENRERTKTRISGREFIKIYDREFRRLKNHPEIIIADDVNYVNEVMEDSQCKELIGLLESRILEFRSKKPKKYGVWLISPEAARIRERMKGAVESTKQG